jgi:hypothetical protein
MTIKEFIERYCMLYDIEEDDFTGDDVEFIESVFYDYATHGELPEFMRNN